MAAVILAVMWQGFPFFAVTLLAGLQAIPGELYEAAAIDGAGAWGKFRHITLPGLAGVIATALLLRMIWVANSLDLILVMTGGGPGTATQTLPLHAFLTRVVGRQLRPGFRARRAADAAAAWCGRDLRLAESRRMTMTRPVDSNACSAPNSPSSLILGFALLPWIWMMLSSIRPDAELTHSPIALWPHQLTLIHHIELLKRTSFAQNLRDSLIVACGAVALGLTLALPAAYAFSRFRFRGRNWLRTQFLVINMFPVVMLILPLFVLMRDFGLLDTYFALIAGHATFTLPFAIWLLTSYVDGIPPELDQAAMIDGATRDAGDAAGGAAARDAGRGGGRHLPVHHLVERIPVRADDDRPQRAHGDGGVAALHRREPDPVGPADGRRHAGGAACHHPVPVRAAPPGGRADRRRGEGMNPIGVISMGYARPFTAAHLPLFARMKATEMDCRDLTARRGPADPTASTTADALWPSTARRGHRVQPFDDEARAAVITTSPRSNRKGRSGSVTWSQGYHRLGVGLMAACQAKATGRLATSPAHDGY